MSNNRYNSPRTIKNYGSLYCIAGWAGGLGVVQSIIWMGLTITGIISYTCNVPTPSKLSYGSLVQTVFMDLYFKGDCNPSGYQGYNQTMLYSVQTIFDSTQILIWVAVYLGVAVFWLVSSVTLLTHVSKEDAQKTIGVLYTWAFFTCVVCCMDVALGVIFGIDYSRFNAAAYDYNLSPINAGYIDYNAAQLVAAVVVTISLMVISFKGFILWLINFGLLISVLVQAARIANDKDGNDTLFMPRKESDDIFSTRPPINAYAEEKTYANAHNNDAFVPDNQSAGTIELAAAVELNQDSIANAARMSTDASLQDRRFRNLDTFQQYPPPRYNTPGSPPIVAAFPAPDYSPPMSRSRQGHSQNGLLRNH